ncbi:hypothetical protein B0H14DRAFT_3137471 [Mycena olivaceomarginata]|nr:hypothetical protein B0H14DRAFT_3137471 [Mycena olivaceomarginata]
MQEDDGRRRRFWEKEKSSWRQKRKKENIYAPRPSPTQGDDAGARRRATGRRSSPPRVLRKRRTCAAKEPKTPSRKHPTEEEKNGGTPQQNERARARDGAGKGSVSVGLMADEEKEKHAVNDERRRKGAHRYGGGTVWHCRVAKFWRPRCLHPSLRVMAFKDDESGLRDVDIDVEEDSALRARWTHIGRDVADADEASYVAWLIVPASAAQSCCKRAVHAQLYRRLDVRELQRVVARAVRGRGVPRQRRQGGGGEKWCSERVHGRTVPQYTLSGLPGGLEKGFPQCIRIGWRNRVETRGSLDTVAGDIGVGVGIITDVETGVGVLG